MSHSRDDIVNVRIYDREYALRTSDDPRRLIEICRELDLRMRETAKSSGSVDTIKVAILTAVSLADDLERCREALQKMDETLSRRSQECVTLLERSLH